MEALKAHRRLLERVATAGLKLHPQKCSLMQQAVTLLEHRLWCGGVSTMDEKVQTVMNWPSPCSVQNPPDDFAIVRITERQKIALL